MNLTSTLALPAGTPKPPLEVWAAPLGYVVAAIIVLTGVVLTIRQNKLNLRHQQLEDRAKARQNTLQAHYSAFISACYQLLLQRERGHSLSAYEDYLNLEAGPEEDTATIRELLRRNQERVSDAAAIAETDASSALAQILIHDTSESRLAVTGSLSDRVPLNGGADTEERERLRGELREFARRVGTELNDDYEHAARLAQKGQFPVRTFTIGNADGKSGRVED